MNIRGKALLFGLNYAHCKSGKLNGCINDVNMMSKYIQSFIKIPIEIYTDDTDLKNTSYDGIINKLYDLAIESYKENLEFVWIHYSGHGSNQKDTSGDETDGYDEGLVPSDYEKKGILIDDLINKIFNSFNPKTKVLFICDSCHSGSMLDLTYTWDAKKQSSVDNPKCAAKASTMLISGCMDNQTSADAYNLLNDNKYVGALTASMLKVLKAKPQHIYDVFVFVEAVRQELQRGGFSQYPCLSSNYDVTQAPSMIPVMRPVVQPTYKPPPKLMRPAYYESGNTYMRNIDTQQPQQPYQNQYPQQTYQNQLNQTFQPIVITYVPIQVVYGYSLSV
jgi:hypothetical protein